MDDAQRRWNFWHLFGLLLTAYLLPFIAVLVDVWFFQGSFYQSLGLRGQLIFANVYRPLIQLIESFFN